MRVYIARHGDAGGFFTDPAIERTRGLTPVGEKAAEQSARELKARDAAPSLIITSPFSRALETANIIGRVLCVPVTTDENLQPDRDLEPFMLGLLQSEQRNIMLVGHHDNLVPMLEDLGDTRVDKLGKAEVRALKMKRKSGRWKELFRIVPPEKG